MLAIRWIILCAAAEFLGITAAGLWYGGVNVWLGEPEALSIRIIAWILMSMAAVPEGVILGGLQAIGIKWFVPDISSSRLILATIGVGFIGWGIGGFIPMFIMTDAPADAGGGGGAGFGSVFAYASLFGLLIGGVFGAGQSLAFPSWRRCRTYWTMANAVGWAISLPMIYAGAQIGADLEGWAPRIAAWATGGLAAGAMIGAATGFALAMMPKKCVGAAP